MSKSCRAVNYSSLVSLVSLKRISRPEATLCKCSFCPLLDMQHRVKNPPLYLHSRSECVQCNRSFIEICSTAQETGPPKMASELSNSLTGNRAVRAVKNAGACRLRMATLPIAIWKICEMILTPDLALCSFLAASLVTHREVCHKSAGFVCSRSFVRSLVLEP